MTDILRFPSRERQAFQFLSNKLTEMLEAKGADQELVEFTLSTLTSVYRELGQLPDRSPAIELPSNITDDLREHLRQQVNTAVEQLNAFHHRKELILASRVVLSELALFQLRRKTISLHKR